MAVPPTWFYRNVEPRVAGCVGQEAARTWVRSRFWYAVAWILAVPIGLTLCLCAEFSASPALVWVGASVSWVAAAVFGVMSGLVGRTADAAASRYLADLRGHRMNVSCPIRPWESQWSAAIARAEAEHNHHVSLAQRAGSSAAIEHLVDEKRASQGVARVALFLIGFLFGFGAGAVIAFMLGQTKSIGVLLVFISASLCGFLLPLSLSARFRRAVDVYRRDVTQELAPIATSAPTYGALSDGLTDGASAQITPPGRMPSSTTLTPAQVGGFAAFSAACLVMGLLFVIFGSNETNAERRVDATVVSSGCTTTVVPRVGVPTSFHIEPCPSIPVGTPVVVVYDRSQAVELDIGSAQVEIATGHGSDEIAGGAVFAFLGGGFLVLAGIQWLSSRRAAPLRVGAPPVATARRSRLAPACGCVLAGAGGFAGLVVATMLTAKPPDYEGGSTAGEWIGTVLGATVVLILWQTLRRRARREAIR